MVYRVKGFEWGETESKTFIVYNVRKSLENSIRANDRFVNKLDIKDRL